MFLPLLRRRNPALLEAAAHLHRAGALPPNTYVLDLDAIERNSATIAAEARRLGLRPFAMTKQIGRNRDAARAIVAGGITEAVGVDLDCATAAALGGFRIGHLGHLVQIPRHQAGEAAALDPAYWTVFSEEKAREAGAAATATGRVQALLLRVIAEDDLFYRGHEGGFPLSDLVAAARRIDQLPGVRVAGVTTFPATLVDPSEGAAVTTPNLSTLGRAHRLLTEAGFTDLEINAPGTTSTAILERLAAAGATQIEPGHGLTGTTPLHALQDLTEEPAVAYVSEVSHLWNDRAYVFGGGLYVDPVLGTGATEALVIGADADPGQASPLAVEMPAPDAIDYYATIPVPSGQARPGDTVLFGFRPQAFVTRALTAGLRGVGTGAPTVAGLWAADGSLPLSAELAETGATR